MIKRILSICCVAFLVTCTIGCSEKNITNNSNNEVQQTQNQNNSSDEGDATNKTEDNVEPVVSNKSEVNSNSNKTETLQDSFLQKDKIKLIGKITKKFDIHMELQITDKDYFDNLGEPSLNQYSSMNGDQPIALYEGSYYYDKYMKNIRVEAEAYSNGYFAIHEFDQNNEYSGSFGGFLESKNVLKGTWSNHKGTPYEFYLVKNTSDIAKLDLNINTNIIGNYVRTRSDDNNFVYLYIISTSDNKFKFHLSGYSNPNIGNVGGIAYYNDESKKEATFYDEKNNIKINFNFDDKAIKVSITGNYQGLYTGAHVSLEGTFEKEN